jgi:hypothetical protein
MAMPERGGCFVNDARDLVRMGLAGLWILDGLLQLQPGMLGPAFVSHVVAPLAAGEPVWIQWLVRREVHLIRLAPTVFDLSIAAIQVGLGILLLQRQARGRRWGLWLSLCWALGVWLFGEALGQLWAGGETALTGAPGSALLYAVASAALLTGRTAAGFRQTATAAVAAMLIGWAILGMVAGSPAAVANTVAAVARMPGPVLLREGTEAVARWLTLHGAVAPDVLTVIPGVLALAWLWPGTRRLALVVLVLWLAGLWWFGMDFGVLGGYGTDPNTPPLVALLAGVAVGGPARRKTRAVRDDRVLADFSEPRRSVRSEGA